MSRMIFDDKFDLAFLGVKIIGINKQIIKEKLESGILHKISF